MKGTLDTDGPDLERYRELLRILVETRLSIANLATLTQNGNGEIRIFDRDWAETNDRLWKLCSEANVSEGVLLRDET